MPLKQLLENAGRSHGVFTEGEAVKHEVSRRALQGLCDRGVVESLGNAVYRVVGSVDTWHQRVMAGVLHSGRQALASHRTAAALGELPHASRRSVEVLVPQGAGRDCGTARRHETRMLTGADVALRSGIPVTSAERTLIDLAAVMRMGRLARLLDDAHELRITTYAKVARRLAGLPTRGRNGVRVLRVLLEERIGSDLDGVRTFENMMLSLIKRSDLPAPIRQQKVESDDDKYYLDFAWPEYTVAVECDGLGSHGSPAAMAYDLARQNDVIEAGWDLRRFTWGNVRLEPERTADTIRRALRSNGWSPRQVPL